MLPDLICLSETKPKNHLWTNASLPGCALHISADSNTNADGFRTYVSENFSVATLGRNSLQFNCEDLWLQIVNKF